MLWGTLARIDHKSRQKPNVFHLILVGVFCQLPGVEGPIGIKVLVRLEGWLTQGRNKGFRRAFGVVGAASALIGATPIDLVLGIWTTDKKSRRWSRGVRCDLAPSGARSTKP